MTITTKMLKINPELATQKNFDEEENEFVRLEMVKANHKLATIENFQDEGDYFVRRKMVQANPKLATQDNFNNELCRREYCSVCIEMLRANKNLATIENYKKANKTLDWYLRLAILKVNPDLATQENFNNEEDAFVRLDMLIINPALKDN